MTKLDSPSSKPPESSLANGAWPDLQGSLADRPSHSPEFIPPERSKNQSKRAWLAYNLIEVRWAMDKLSASAEDASIVVEHYGARGQGFTDFSRQLLMAGFFQFGLAVNGPILDRMMDNNCVNRVKWTTDIEKKMRLELGDKKMRPPEELIYMIEGVKSNPEMYAVPPASFANTKLSRQHWARLWKLGGGKVRGGKENTVKWIPAPKAIY